MDGDVEDKEVSDEAEKEVEEGTDKGARMRESFVLSLSNFVFLLLTIILALSVDFCYRNNRGKANHNRDREGGTSERGRDGKV